MSKHSKNNEKENFEIKIGFEKGLENEASLSLSDFEIEGKLPRSISFFSESDNSKIEGSTTKDNPLQVSNPSGHILNDTQGLNHGFFEENSESGSEKHPEQIFDPEFSVKTPEKPKKLKKHSKDLPQENSENIQNIENIEIIIPKEEKILKPEKNEYKSNPAKKEKNFYAAIVNLV